MADAIVWPADKVERMSVAALVPYAKNARLHSDAQIAEIVASIKEWGWTIPVLVDESGEMIAGHGRLLAAARLGFDTVPGMVARGWSEKQIKAYRLADNQLALNASWDTELLLAELGELSGLESLIGFSEDDLLALAGGARKGMTDPDAVPPLPDVPISQFGDLWICGKHRLLCGDATDPDSVARLLDGAKPNLMVTDPPYGVSLDMEWRDRAGLNPPSAPAERSYMKEHLTHSISGDTRADWSEAFALVPSISIAYVWHATAHMIEVGQGLLSIGFDLRQQIIWAKPSMVISRSAYHWQHEPCWYAVRKGSTARWRGGNSQTTLWEAASPKQISGGSKEQKFDHPTQKPIVLYDRAISNHTVARDAVYEPFSGSGTAIVACEQLARTCIAMELDPRFIDVAVQRWQAFTGEAATLDGVSFAAVAETRKSGPSKGAAGKGSG